MSVIRKKTREELCNELKRRYEALYEVLQGRELSDPSEGTSHGGHWFNPETLRYVDSLQAGLRSGDFMSILSEIGKLK